jgi:hypothetical protein
MCLSKICPRESQVSALRKLKSFYQRDRWSGHANFIGERQKAQGTRRKATGIEHGVDDFGLRTWERRKAIYVTWLRRHYCCAIIGFQIAEVVQTVRTAMHKNG